MEGDYHGGDGVGGGDTGDGGVVGFVRGMEMI